MSEQPVEIASDERRDLAPFDDNMHYLLSYYRTSEISGSLFFGRLAKMMRPGPVQHDMSKHFADEAQHAWYWTDCCQQLGRAPLKLVDSYQDQYNEAVGVPANLMEVLAITQVFERRVINAYERHRRIPHLHPTIEATIARIMDDEKWHIRWIKGALERMEPDYGKDHIDATIQRYWEADKEVYQKTMKEHEERLEFLLGQAAARG